MTDTNANTASVHQRRKWGKSGQFDIAWRYYLLTAAYGPVGLGWGHEIVRTDFTDGHAVCAVRVWISEAGKERRFSAVHEARVRLDSASALPRAADDAFEACFKEMEATFPIRQIVLSRGVCTMVDAADFNRVSEFNWSAMKSIHSWYAVRQARKGEGKGTIQLHRFLTDAGNGLYVDHRDRNGLNNLRSNLRVCTNQQNSTNTRPRPGTSKFKGVSLDRRRGDWSAQVHVNGRKNHLGYFKSEEEAARAYDRAAAKHFGAFAYLNFPEEQNAVHP